MSKSNTFPKNEKLCGEIRIGKLFAEGEAFIVYPLRIVYKLSTEVQDVPVKVLISVPKKKIKTAIHRNRIKRQIKEAYRLNKTTLIESCREHGLSLQLAITYLSDKSLDYKLIEEKIKQVLTKMLQLMPS
ncbi:MAG: ribonuclease P protein component [Paludibacter sp.]|nr:ribonuclease P protein component [Paludibacter sp.]